MVVLSRVIFAKFSRKYLRNGFRDSLKISVSGGIGGNGLPKFGGIGGQGGDVIAIGANNVTLDEVYTKNRSKLYKGENGFNSSHNFILGPPGKNVLIEVPVGVTVVTELGKRIGEINQAGEELLLAKGGTGGNRKNGFLGTKGQAYPVIFDLKLIADIGLVGFPNAGKSTLLRGISAAKPKVASYPFTTVRPHIGIIKFKDLREISMADLPGLIEGAHLNRGMGHRFLKHVERTKLVLMLVDINGFQLGPEYPHRNCEETIMLLHKELELYNEELLRKPAILVINKMDSEEAQEKLAEVEPFLKHLKRGESLASGDKSLKFMDVMTISAKENPDDVQDLKLRLRSMLDIISDSEEQALESAN